MSLVIDKSASHVYFMKYRGIQFYWGKILTYINN